MFVFAGDISAQGHCAQLFISVQNSKVEVTDDQHKVTEFRKILRGLKSKPKIKQNFAAHNFSDSNQSSTIESHTIDVFIQFKKQARELPSNSELMPLMNLIIALHDIGKPDAILAVIEIDNMNIRLPP